MNILRKLTIFIATPLLSMALLLLIVSWAIMSFIGTPQPVKATLKEAKVYDHALTTMLAESQKQEPNESPNQIQTEEISFDQPEIKAAAEKSFTPEFLQQSTEKVIDGTYGWLDGTSAEPAFSIDISSVKQSFIEQVSGAAVTRVQALPVCTNPDQIQTEDPFAASCQPPGFNAEAERQKFLAEFKLDEGPLKDNTLTFSDLQQEGNKPLSQQFPEAPKVFQFAKILPIILTVVALALVGLIILASTTRTKALRTLSKIFLSIGISALILTLIAWYMSNKIAGTTRNQLEADILRGAQIAAGTVRRTLLIGSVAYTLIGIGCWLLAKKLDGPLTEEKKANNVNTVLGTKELSDENAVPLEDPSANKPTETEDLSTVQQNDQK